VFHFAGIHLPCSAAVDEGVCVAHRDPAITAAVGVALPDLDGEDGTAESPLRRPLSPKGTTKLLKRAYLFRDEPLQHNAKLDASLSR
jgi:hypothetical protein